MSIPVECRGGECILSGNNKQRRREVSLWLWLDGGLRGEAPCPCQPVIDKNQRMFLSDEKKKKLAIIHRIASTPPSSDILKKSLHSYQPKVTVRWSESCIAGIDKADKSLLLDIIWIPKVLWSCSIPLDILCTTSTKELHVSSYDCV